LSHPTSLALKLVIRYPTVIYILVKCGFENRFEKTKVCKYHDGKGRRGEAEGEKGMGETQGSLRIKFTIIYGLFFFFIHMCI
jgi:hypothetical protein